MRRAAVVLAILSVIFWSLAGLSDDTHVFVVTACAAVAGTSLTGACLIAYAMRDRDKDMMVKAMADFSWRRVTAPTRPEYRLHVVRGARSR